MKLKLKKPTQSQIVKLLWVLFLTPIIVIFFIIFLIPLEVFGPVPSFDELENPKNKLASEVIASDQQLLGKYYEENRTTISFENVSPHLMNALIATEDIRFEKHSGIDIRALGRAVTGMMTGNKKGGASTISQQLAKNLYPRDTLPRFFLAKIGKMAVIKLKEWVTAVKLERNYTKEEIIVMYLNTVTFGHNAFGIKSATKIFFNKAPDSVNVEEAALLVGMLRAPSRYSPVLKKENSIKRRNTVLSQMEKYGFIPANQLDSLQKLPIHLTYQEQTHVTGLSTYFREYLRWVMTRQKPKRKNYHSEQLEQFKEDLSEWEDNPLYGWCNKNLKADGTPYDLYRDGLKIYTTINSKMQKYAEESVQEHLGGELQNAFFKECKNNKNGPFAWDMSKKQIDALMWSSIRRSDRYKILKKDGKDSSEIMQNFKTPVEMKLFSWKGEKDTTLSPYDSIFYYKYYLHAGFMAMEPKTGHVRAYVGGIDYRYFKFDNVKRSKRQVGSTFKPFVYCLAMASGISPCTKIANIPYTIPMPDGQADYTPRYSKSKSDGKMITLRTGLAASLNQVSAWIMKQFTPQAVVSLVRRLGVKSFIDPVPSICVGAAEVTVYEMVGAYSAFVNKGVYTQPIMVTRIEDKNGNTIARFKPKKSEAISQETAYLMLYLMSGVVNEGTASRIRNKYKLMNDIAGKTGTTNNNSDGWFIGVTPSLAAGAWVGGEERSIHFSSGFLGMGSNMALPIWGKFYTKVYADKSLNVSIEKFEKPNLLETELDCAKFAEEERENDGLFEDEDDFFK